MSKPRGTGCADGPTCRPGPVFGGLAAHRWATIHLGRPLPAASSGLPADSGGQPSNVRAPGEPGFLTLLQVGFAEPNRFPDPLVVSYATVSPLPGRRERRSGGLFSVALSRGLPRVGVTHHPALWSPDLPRTLARRRQPAVARSAHPHPQDRPTAGQGLVRISAPSSVTSNVCSNWALRRRSAVTTVQLSGHMVHSWVPRLSIGSMVNVMPGRIVWS